MKGGRVSTTPAIQLSTHTFHFSRTQEVPDADSDEELEALLAGTSRSGVLGQQPAAEAAAADKASPEVC